MLLMNNAPDTLIEKIVIPKHGIALLSISFVALGSLAIAMAQTGDFPSLPDMTVIREYAGPTVHKAIGWSIASLTSGWALLYRKRSH